MISLTEYFRNTICENNILIETSNLIIENIINESFQSSLLSNLAKEIKKAESQHKSEDKKRAESWKQNGYSGTPEKSEKSFASIFGPITKTQRYGSKKTGIQGLKWSEIKDSDFQKFKGDDKEFIKLLKKLYSKKIKADIIVCKQESQEILYFIKGYSDFEDIRIYQFKSNQSWKSGVQEITAPKYKYNERSLKVNETLDLIKDCDVYFLEINDSMIKNYDQLHKDRKEAQEGIINYDEKSLEDLLTQQKARYKRMVDQARKMKLASDPNKLLEEIKKTNDEVTDLFKQVVNNPDNLDQRFQIDDLIRYTSYSYEEFYKAMVKMREAEKSQYSGEYDREYAKNYLKSAKEYLDKVKDKITEIKAKIK